MLGKDSKRLLTDILTSLPDSCHFTFTVEPIPAKSKESTPPPFPAPVKKEVSAKKEVSNKKKAEDDLLDEPVVMYDWDFLSFDEIEEEARQAVLSAREKRIPLDLELAIRRSKKDPSSPKENSQIYEWRYPDGVKPEGEKQEATDSDLDKTPPLPPHHRYIELMEDVRVQTHQIRE